MAKLKRIAIFVLLLVIVLLAPSFIQSNNLKNKGDALTKQDKLEEALLYYKEAYKIFPLRNGLSEDISATQLLLNSELEYSQIEDQTYAEIQEIPQTVPRITLKEGQLFLPILMYHHIRINPRPNDANWANLNVSPEMLDAELNYLATNNYHTVMLDDLYNALNKKGSLPQNPIILTFDDGYENFYTDAYPLLKKYKMKATAFIITQVVDNNSAYLTWDQIKEMDKSGLIQFESHTQHHPNLPDLTQAIIDAEITKSKDDLENHLGKTINWFAYPYGSYNSYILSEAQKAGYLGAVSTIYGAVQDKNNIYLLQRIGADGRFTLNQFIDRLAR